MMDGGRSPKEVGGDPKRAEKREGNTEIFPNVPNAVGWSQGSVRGHVSRDALINPLINHRWRPGALLGSTLGVEGRDAAVRAAAHSSLSDPD